jgi:beta-glucosidase
VYETPEQRRLAREIATASMVLLKNENYVLPLAKTISTLAVIGPNAHSARNLFADYSHPAHIENLLLWTPAVKTLLNLDLQADGLLEGSVRAPTILDAIREQVAPTTRVVYAAGCGILDADRSGFEEAVRVAHEADAVVLVVGDKAGLARDCTTGEARDRADLGLPGVQQELVEAVAAVGKPTIVVLVNGRPLAIPWIAEHIPAIVEAWLPGEEGGGAVAEVLFGDANPGGKLPITFPRAVGQVPIFYNHKPSGGRSLWHGDYVELPTSPLYSFGHGLSYTQFEYSSLCVEPRRVEPDGQVTVRVEIKNVGARAGDEVVQLYIQDPVASLPRPVQELKGFRRLRLDPGETRTVEFEIHMDQLAFYDEAMQLVVEPGTFRVMVGSSSRDIRLRDAFEIVGAKPQVVARRGLRCVTRVN